MIFGLLYFCVVILCVNRSRSSFILYRIVKRHSRQSNARRIWTCADNAFYFRFQYKGGDSLAKNKFCHVTLLFPVVYLRLGHFRRNFEIEIMTEFPEF